MDDPLINIQGRGRTYIPDAHIGIDLSIVIDLSGLCFLHICDSAICLPRYKVVELLRTREWVRKGRAWW